MDYMRGRDGEMGVGSRVVGGAVSGPHRVWSQRVRGRLPHRLNLQHYIFELVLWSTLLHLTNTFKLNFIIRRMSIIKWALVALAVVVFWFIGGLLWNKVIKPFFQEQVRDIRTSVIPQERQLAQQVDDNICCFCLAEPKVYRLVSTCSHSFCADCIFDYYRKKGNERMDCPLCRKPIIALFKAFEEKEPKQKVEGLRGQVREYNGKFGDDRSIRRKVGQLPFILVRTLDFLFSMEFLLFFLSSAVFVKAVGVFIVYQLLPYDLMPSSLLGSVGYVDNTLVFIGVLAFSVGQAGLQYYVQRQ